jgi:hypothetical protein
MSLASTTESQGLSKKEKLDLEKIEENEPYQHSFPFFKSHEGVAEYEKIGVKYPRTMSDDWYARFLKLTRATKKEEQKQYIGQVKRLILSNGEEYIVHDVTETRYDALHNRKRFYRSNIGMYAKPIPHREIKARVTEEDGFIQEIVTTVESIETGYSIHFTQKNIDKLIVPYTDGNTQYSIEKQDYKSGITISVALFEDWRHGKYEELLRFGHRASEYERQILADEKQGKYVQYPPAGNTGQYR